MDEIAQVRLFFLTEEAGTRATIRFGIWLATLSTMTQSHAISNHYARLQKFQESPTFWFGWINALKIKI